MSNTVQCAMCQGAAAAWWPGTRSSNFCFWNVQQTIFILQNTLCSAVCQCHNMQCELLYNVIVQCAINNVESSSTMTSDEGWLHDWGSTAAFNQVSPFTQLCWNTQMSPTIVFIRIRSPKLEQNLMSSQTKRSNASNRVSPFTQLGSLLPDCWNTQMSPTTSIFIRIRSPKWEQNLKSHLKEVQCLQPSFTLTSLAPSPSHD